MAARQAGSHQPEDQARRSHPLRLSRLQGLTRFIDDGRIELDNNRVERSIRGIKLSRKNALFAGSDGGAEHWAVVASLVETCKLNDVDLLAYLTDVLTKIVNGHPNRDIDQLLPGPTALNPSRPWPENDAYARSHSR
ncbi:transposase domain-containing protein [Bradyrhizobium genosp. A]|uniref:transposase domain-containing protein n=1 Tax=Bradyrhizobium genosp. A TaxID=83626 RepID=UPI003CEFEDC8